jgi:hypothetical protein
MAAAAPVRAAAPAAPRRPRWRALAVAALFALPGAGALAASGPDYIREGRWAQEILPALVVGDPVYLGTPQRSKVLALLTTPAGTAKGGVILLHGLGLHPDWGLIGVLRTDLADAGFATLSVQMPVLANEAPRADYPVTLPEAGDRIAAAIAFLRSRGVARIAIVSHSFGARAADAYLARPDALPIDAWVPVGMPAAFSARPQEPVLDVVAERDLPEVKAAAPRRGPELPKDGCSRQVVVAGDHFFGQEGKALVAAIVPFLERALGGGCAKP